MTEDKVEFDLLGEDELKADTTERHYLISGLDIERGKIVLIASRPGVMKTWLSLEIGSKVASGGLLFNNKQFSTEQSAVLYIDLENGRDELARRYWKLTDKKSGNFYHITNNEIRVNGKAEQQDMTIDVRNSKGKALDSQPLENLIKLMIKQKGIGLLVIDPLIFISQGNENDTGDMRDLFKIFKRICFETNVTILVNHHVNKSKYENELDAIRGNTAIAGASDSIYFLEPRNKKSEEEEESDYKSAIIVKNIKQRGSLKHPPFVLSLEDSYDKGKTLLVYEGLLKHYKPNTRINACKADVLRFMVKKFGEKLPSEAKFVNTSDVLAALANKHEEGLTERAIGLLKDEGEVCLYNEERGKLTFKEYNKTKNPEPFK